MQPAAASWNRAVSAESVWSIERGDALDRTRALDRFLAGVERRAFRMAQIATRDADDAMDLVQEAMLKLVQHYASRDEAEWGPLFHRILQSKIRDWYRRASVRNRLRVWFGHKEDDEESNALEQVPDTSSVNADEQLSQKRAAQALEIALRDLPLRQQQAFLLRVWEEYDVAETARIMGCSEGSVKTHLFRAVHALRDRLGEHWP
jgi:RNA polymerase sigma-70 factor (ECF subfamily)